MPKIISILTHPFSLLLVGVLIIFNTSTYINFSYPDELKWIVYAVLFVNTMVLPVVFSWYLVSRGHVKSISMDDINDRKLVYFFTFLLYLVTQFVMSGLNVPAVIYKYSFGATLTVGMLFVFALLRRKLSAHMAGIGGLTGALVMLSFRLQTDLLLLICLLLVLAGIIAVARMMMRAHKESEIYWGFLLGFFAQYFIFN